MGAFQDLTPGLTEGLHIGAVIGSRIAQNRLEQQRLDRLFQQTQFANQITLRDQAIQEAEAARKAQDFQQLQDFGALIRNTPMPGGGDLSPQDQPAMEAQRASNLMAQAPPSMAAKGLEQGLSDYEKIQRLDKTLTSLQERTANLEAGRTTRAAMRGDESSLDRMSREESQRLNREAAGARTESRNAGSMARARFVQGAIDARATGRTKSEQYPAGTPASIYDELLTAQQAGGKEGKVEGGTYVEGGGTTLFGGRQLLDTLIEQYSQQVPPATKLQIEARHAAKVAPKPDQTTPESAPVGEPSTVPVPTESAPAIDPLPAKKSDLVKDKLYKTPNHGVLRWNGNAFEKP